MRHFGIKPLAAPALTMRGRHVGLCSCLVDEHEMLGIELLPGLLLFGRSSDARGARRRAGRAIVQSLWPAALIEIVPAIERGPGDAEFLQCAFDRQGRLPEYPY
jgi:hypothetical protein